LLLGLFAGSLISRWWALLAQPLDCGIGRIRPLLPDLLVNQNTGFLQRLVGLFTVETGLIPVGPNLPTFIGIEQMGLAVGLP
jgi:hypothetical protein